MSTQRQQRWLGEFARRNEIKLNMRILRGILFLLRTGCQWRLLPSEFGHWKSVYHHFRSWSERSWFRKMLTVLLKERRVKWGSRHSPTVIVIDSQSTRSGLRKSVKGIDGNKRIKGIKRHIAVDSEGLPIEVVVIPANTHDSKGAYRLIPHAAADYKSISVVKADNGYRGNLGSDAKDLLSVELRCVKSDFGTSDLVPIDGRWVVERTIAWLENFRRLTRNYEQRLHTAAAMTRMAFLVILLKYI